MFKLLLGASFFAIGGVLFWYAASEFLFRAILALFAMWLMRYGLTILQIGAYPLVVD